MVGIALSGKAGSGKSSLAEAIVHELVRRGYKTCALSLSDAIREEMVARYGHIKRGTPEYRTRMVRVGDEGRLQDPVCWVRAVAPTILRCLDEHRVVVIDDVRTRDEAEMLEHLGYSIVRVEASVGLRANRLADRGENPEYARAVDVTETDLDGYPFDFTIRSRARDAKFELRDLARQIVWKCEDPCR